MNENYKIYLNDECRLFSTVLWEESYIYGE
jgi:hypothetical protein